MIPLIARFINLLANLLVLLVFVDSVISFFLNPYHLVRNAIDHIVNPLLAPIRRIVPLVGMLDLSPLILIILIEIVSYALINFLYAL
jgi:YggT family protein